MNDVPHIGHAYTEVAADVLVRWHRQAGEDVWLLAGTDEHGQKILRTAAAQRLSPAEWTDRLVHDSWRPLLEALRISADDFIRTTEDRHKVVVIAFLTLLREKGLVYEGTYEGFYCVGCEEYKQESDIIAGTGAFAGQVLCPVHARSVDVVNEKNYFFKMSAFQDRLLEMLADEEFLRPAAVRNEILAFVGSGLKDISITRSSFDWGVEVPWEPGHVVYVWFDALLNYISGIGWGSDVEEFDRRWPDVHIIGKDIARLHAVLWPAMLMAADLPVPKRIVAHGWLLVNGEKMSKSNATGIGPEQIVKAFGIDAFRYYFVRSIVFGQDGSFSWDDIHRRYNADLANGLGNLVSRTIAMITKYRAGIVPEAAAPTAAEDEVRHTITQARANASAAIDRFALSEALGQVWTIVERLNSYITEQTPWSLARDEAQAHRLDTVLNTVAEGLRELAVLLRPFLPDTAQAIWAGLGAEAVCGDLRRSDGGEGRGRRQPPEGCRHRRRAAALPPHRAGGGDRHRGGTDARLSLTAEEMIEVARTTAARSARRWTNSSTLSQQRRRARTDAQKDALLAQD
ncbi:methionine--tRNA ligase [Leifsonia xyli]|uniref:methionine--tRNA ligase n=1 Tax=Leifsonia xyli TaxID=1575 RepID=UPI0002EE4B70|nr:methionine--tRNA ligase [Leifsonia xyli]